MPRDSDPKRSVADLHIDDPVELEVTRNSLVGICEEMGVAMLRTSYSTMFNEARDFSCVVFDAQGEMIAQGDFCPAHIGAIVHTVEWAIKEVGPDNMHPGDVILQQRSLPGRVPPARVHDVEALLLRRRGGGLRGQHRAHDGHRRHGAGGLRRHAQHLPGGVAGCRRSRSTRTTSRWKTSSRSSRPTCARPRCRAAT